ncbi:MAG: hypothetical protein DRI77_08170 [Chloroflexi bacterium]|nr:MAG: hypothetical protein DRI77_08170 [Chloroflexota bacterium]
MQATRERILNILKERQQATVGELCRELGLTAVTVRYHLEILRGEGLVAEPSARPCEFPGRPRYVYTLTGKAGAFFPQRYDRLADLILSEVRLLSSPGEMGRMMERIGERIAGQADLSVEGDFKARLLATIEFLNEQGYLARCEQSDDGVHLLHIANCPYERVAERDQVVCVMDMAMLTSLLGVVPRRIASVAQGDRQCTYVIHPPDR